MGRVMLAAPLVMRAMVKPAQKRSHAVGLLRSSSQRPMRAIVQPRERRTSISPTRATWRKPKVLSSMMVLSHAVSALRRRVSQACSRPTRATPESAEPSRAVNSDMPKRRKKRAVIQSMSGGFSSQGWPFQSGVSQSPESMEREMPA